MADHDIIIIGGGMAGLVAAFELQQEGYAPLLLERDREVGGRVQTDYNNGYTFDRGFQVLLTAYPEAQRYFDYAKLDLKKFLPGARIYTGNGWTTLGDPLRNPGLLFPTLISNAGNLADKWRIFRLSQQLKGKTVERIFEEPEKRAMQYLWDKRFSKRVIDRFFKPFFSGIFLDSDLETSSRMLEFTYKMFSEGYAAVPRQGMQQLANQLASKLAKVDIQTGTPVERVLGNRVELASGKVLTARMVIIATTADKLLANLAHEEMQYRHTTNIYFEAPEHPLDRPMLMLVSHPDFTINSVADMSAVSPDYAPGGKALLSVSVNRLLEEDDATLVKNLRPELQAMFGDAANHWNLLRIYRIKNALPQVADLKSHISPTESKIMDRVVVAGDYLLNPSLNAALTSGRIAAQKVKHVLSTEP